ncbi:10286_t:CDS:2 [Dentiscutata erythropus]|uniref:10286_t:CDS:1 n=1 Tax=Dentiscutata erythropus TaxID=1348616 RepID=A0A9N9BJB2_9GLOM|nr:10286_t:CDS:2 [Dentiscutata erythropus]
MLPSPFPDLVPSTKDFLRPLFSVFIFGLLLPVSFRFLRSFLTDVAENSEVQCHWALRSYKLAWNPFLASGNFLNLEFFRNVTIM